MSTRSISRAVCLLTAQVLWAAAPGGAADVNGTLAVDPTRLAGADGLGQMQLYAPDPVEPGSSISHWDTAASPALLMLPFVAASLPIGEVDLTLPHLRDIGWREGSSTISIRVKDDPGEGFRDTTTVPAAPDNPGGTTLGSQRLAAVEWAAEVWGALLGSSIEINVETRFVDTYDCDETGAVLAAASTTFVYSDFENAPRGGTWYHAALAESLAGSNLTTQSGQPPISGDLVVYFNSKIDEGCLAPGSSFYYGLDGNTPAGKAPFAMVTLHEMGHGLGFANFVNESDGALLSGLPDIFTVFTFDHDLQLHWDIMTDAERVASVINSNRVVWDGPQTTDATAGILDNAPTLTIASPGSIAGTYAVKTAVFGPPLTLSGSTGNLAIVDDGSASPTLGCGPLINPEETGGKIAVIDRGTCLFTEKVKNAQNAGAIAAVVVNNQPHGLPPMGGNDSSVTIPSVGISKADGDAIKRILERPNLTTRIGGRRRVPVGN